MTINENNLSDDLEKKIDEAEMEEQIEESNTESEPAASFEGEVTESPEVTPDEKKKPGKAQLVFRRILIWLVVISYTNQFLTNHPLQFVTLFLLLRQ